MPIVAGGTFRCKDNTLTGEIEHLWVILSDPTTHPECVVIVNVTTTHTGDRVVRHYDPACDLRPGDHSLITHHSFVFYREALVRSKSQLEDANIVHKATISAGVLQRIRDGAGKTRFIEHMIKKQLIEQGIIATTT